MGYNQNGRKKIAKARVRFLVCSVLAALVAIQTGNALAGDLDQIKRRGVVRHLGIPYARFVTGSGDGLDVELIQGFAQYLGVGYEYVPTSWQHGFGDLTGKDMVSGKRVPVRGDILASGITILAWRKKLVAFSTPTFASQVWLIAGSGHPLSPIRPNADVMADIRAVRTLVKGRAVMGVAHTCLDPVLYELDKSGALIQYFEGRLNDLAPAVINTTAGLVLLDVPDALVALEKWPGQLKVIGPVSTHQKMGAAMDKGAVKLKQVFDLYLKTLVRQGRYQAMVETYYPGFVQYFPDFFSTSGFGPGRNSP